MQSTWEACRARAGPACQLLPWRIIIIFITTVINVIIIIFITIITIVIIFSYNCCRAGQIDRGAGSQGKLWH
jgi:hypothetical protein